VVNKSGGQLIDNGGTINVDGAATGGTALIEGSGTLVFNGSASVDTTTSVKFQAPGYSLSITLAITPARFLATALAIRST
jgi:hypothetical protein